VIDCRDPDALSKFWAQILGYTLQEPPPGFASWEDWLREMGIPEQQWNDASAIVDPDGARPRIFFQRVPEPKIAKNRVHLDVNAGGRGTPPEERKRLVGEAVARAESLGAKRLYEMDLPERGEYWITLTDPEGNEFCIQ
jgi:hypothetical protein